MRIMKKAISLSIALTLLLVLTVSASATVSGFRQYIQPSREPLDTVHIVGTMPAMPGNPAVAIDERAYLVSDDTTISVTLPSGGTYSEGMSMLDFPAGYGDPGFTEPLVNRPVSHDGLYTYLVFDGAGVQVEEFRYITESYADKLTGLGFTITASAGASIPAFTDIAPGAYYTEPVAWALERKITTGTTATTFSPDQTCTRAQIITFLWRAAGSPEPETLSSFSDVDAEQYYAKAAAWAGENGMADGDRFYPDDPCSRLMAVEFMWNQAGSPQAPLAQFTDVSSGAVNWALEAGVTTGTGETTFSPDTICTRGQIVTFLYRAFAE